MAAEGRVVAGEGERPADRLRTAQAVSALIGSRPLSDHQRRMLAALIVILGEVDHGNVDPLVRTAYVIAVDALAGLPS